MSSSSSDSSFETGVLTDDGNWFLYDSGEEADLESEAEASDAEIAILGIDPYSFEPSRIVERCHSEGDTYASGSDLDTDPIEKNLRIDNTAWCTCGKCRQMPTEVECICCRELNGIPAYEFGGKFFLLQNNSAFWQ